MSQKGCMVNTSSSYLKNQGDHIRSLLIGCQKNDRESQKLLYQNFYAYGMSICLPYADDREEAAEVLNDGFMKIFKNVKTFDLSRPFEPWFRKIMVNTAINSYRQHRLVIHGVEMEKARHAAQPENTLSHISYQEIIDLLRKLPQAYRTVFNLYAIEGYKHEEIAEMLGISVGTSKSNLHRAKEALKKHLNIFFETDYVES